MRIFSFSPHHKAIYQAIIVTILWSTSWILIKFGLKASIPALTFAGLRYTAAFLCLLPFFLLNRQERQKVKDWPTGIWIRIIGLGIIMYTIAQGSQFLALAELPTANVNLILTFTPLLVSFLSIFTIKEHTKSGQIAGIILCLLGELLFFYPFNFPAQQIQGIIFAVLCLLSNAITSIFSRHINLLPQVSPLSVTTVSMGIGSFFLLGTGLLFQGINPLTWTDWGVILWMAIVNTAFAFTLWNITLKTLTAVESSIINGLMLPFVAILAWIFLSEQLTIRKIISIIIVMIGTWVVQSAARRVIHQEKFEV